MSAPLDPPPPNPAVPVAAGGVTVIPKTAAEQQRSSRYNWAISGGIGALSLFLMLAGVAPSLVQPLVAVFPGHEKMIAGICGLVAAIGAGLRANQLGNSAKTATTVNLSPQGGTYGGTEQ